MHESACIYETAINWMSESLSSSLKGYKLGPLVPLANRVPVRGGTLSFYRLRANLLQLSGFDLRHIISEGALVNV